MYKLGRCMWDLISSTESGLVEIMGGLKVLESASLLCMDHREHTCIIS